MVKIVHIISEILRYIQTEVIMQDTKM